MMEDVLETDDKLNIVNLEDKVGDKKMSEMDVLWLNGEPKRGKVAGETDESLN